MGAFPCEYHLRVLLAGIPTGFPCEYHLRVLLEDFTCRFYPGVYSGSLITMISPGKMSGFAAESKVSGIAKSGNYITLYGKFIIYRACPHCNFS